MPTNCPCPICNAEGFIGLEGCDHTLPERLRAKGEASRRQWADKYRARWYLHYDGTPPHDDDQDYEWTGTQWVPIEVNHDPR
jgi:hypothetical protein